MLEITLDDRAVRAALERIGRRLANLRPVMRGIATELEARVEARFERQQDPAGRPWAPLKPATVARKKRKGAILYDSGDMQGSLNSAAGDTWAQVDFGQPYAAFHEWGTRHMPPLCANQLVSRGFVDFLRCPRGVIWCRQRDSNCWPND